MTSPEIATRSSTNTARNVGSDVSLDPQEVSVITLAQAPIWPLDWRNDNRSNN